MLGIQVLSALLNFLILILSPPQAIRISLGGEWETQVTGDELNQKGPWEGEGREATPSHLPLRPNFHREGERNVWVRGRFPALLLNRDLTIRQRRRPWKLRWNIDSASFQTISRLSQVAQLIKRREFRLEMRRGDRARVQTEMVEFIALPFPSSKNLLKIWWFHVVIVQERQRNVQKSVKHVQSCCFAN